MAPYVPKKGDFVILTFDPQAGHEQKGRRPALVVSNALFNRHTGLAMVCPITKVFREIPFHVAVPEESSLTGYIMVERLKSVDSARRRVKFIEKAPGFVLDEVLGILDACLYAPQE
ncbi:MAG: type II toxin-antitoxin system PemK/MazF family toxin [Nitrospira sp.]|nr:type II toxin-antitoxin system PemK/MazF family toxin [Nitrospira sp.]MDE0404235.1 type II toxin-antitoxin system PemK/MazF family toxin [Nitrospira sp.]MDE0486907.1 type II toxin-antitoxin system PemK/MazF family toxin [Nitrospira sp.]